MLALLLSDAFAQQPEAEPPPPDLLEFLGSWEQPADASAADLIDMLDVWDGFIQTKADDDE